ncbi:MAG: DUF92 domain-containing protein [Bacilli bacterium]
MSNWLGLLVSVIYILAVLGLASFCYKKKKLTALESRKFAHIGLCNWWLIAWIFFDNYIFASILPAIFIIINYCNYRFNFIPGIEEKVEKKRTMGTVWYTISLFILSVLLFQHKSFLFIGAIAILILGYGDGLAGLIGSIFGKHKLGVNNKSVEGSLTVFIMSFIISVLLLQSFMTTNMTLVYGLYIAMFAMMVELYSPKGLDNLLLPLGVALYAYLLTSHFAFIESFALGFTISSLVVFFILIKKSLTVTASFWALILGSAIYVLSGPIVFGALIFFFLSSTLIEHYHHKPLEEKQRNLNQVIENSFACLLFSIMYFITGSEIALTAAFVSIAGATADTWSSSIGYYSKSKVKSILTGKPLPKGESGGVTWLGSFGALLGSLLVALLSLLAPTENMLMRFIIVLGFGLFTSLIDSIFGILLQIKYYNKKTGEVLEKKPKQMGNIERISGYSFLTNGMVNFTTIMISAILSCIVSLLI